MNDDPANTRTGSPPNPQAAQPHSLRSGQSTTCTFAIVAFTLIIIINVVKMIIDTFDLMITIIIFLCNDVITIMVIILATISFTQTRQISKYEVFVSDKPLHG